MNLDIIRLVISFQVKSPNKILASQIGLTLDYIRFQLIFFTNRIKYIYLFWLSLISLLWMIFDVQTVRGRPLTTLQVLEDAEMPQ